MDKIDEIINKMYKILRRYRNVLNVAKGTKWVKGEDTGEPCIVFYVRKKTKRIPPEHFIPSSIEGVKTDVIELKPKDYKLGKTKVSKLPPEIQKKIAGGVKKDGN